MDKDARYAKCEERKGYHNYWTVDLMKTCIKKPGFCCYAACCPYCASYGLRKQALYNDMSRYICCHGACPCSGRMKESECPEFCLCMEVFCCFAQSVVSTRWMIQDELDIQTTKCDNCIIGTMICMQYLACICSIVACLTGDDTINDLANILDCVADILWCSVCACMQTQHKVELSERDSGRRGAGTGPQAGGMMAPSIQMMPTGAYGTTATGQPSAYGTAGPQAYPQPGYAATPQQGYPQQGYPQIAPPQGYPNFPPQGSGYYPPQQNMYK